jgi:hypothetical protein
MQLHGGVIDALQEFSGFSAGIDEAGFLRCERFEAERDTTFSKLVCAGTQDLRSIYQSLFVPPLERALGNLERRYPFSKTNCLANWIAY